MWQSILQLVRLNCRKYSATFTTFCVAGYAVMHGSILPVTIPPGILRGFAILFSLGGLFSTPGHPKRDNSPPPRLLIDHKYVVLCATIAKPDVLTRT